jgi:6-phosphogluconolactonase (cycloisomerase 2 family)
VGVNPVGADGRVGEPLQVLPTARNAHSIRTDNTNRFVFVPHLGTDQVFQFLFDEKSGRLTANTPPVLQLKQGTGPRHLIVSIIIGDWSVPKWVSWVALIVAGGLALFGFRFTADENE